MSQKRKRNVKDVIVDPQKLKIVHEYKKMARKENPTGSKQVSGGNFEKKRKKVFSQTSKTNDVMIAYKTNLKNKEKKNKIKIDKQEQEKIKEQKRKERHQIHRKLKERTSKGQPIMKNQIEHLLNKIEQKKDIYCP